MREFILLSCFFILAVETYGQKLYSVLKLTAPFSGISYTKGHNLEEFRPSVARINFSWGADIIYQHKKGVHKISIEQVPFDKYFKLINKFIQPPNTDNLLGHVRINFGTGIDHFILSYAFQLEGKKEKGFLFNSRIRFNYSAGAGVSLNRSKNYWANIYSNSADGWTNPHTYMAYEAEHSRKGAGIFIRTSGGFNFISKKTGRRKLAVELFYNQGLKDMAHYDIHYRYGYWNDPNKQVDVPHQILRSRGTTFGFSVGVPIVIIK